MIAAYFATFIPGFAEIVAKSLVKDVPGIIVENISESSIVFKANEDYEKVNSLMYLNNVFFLFHSFSLEKETPNGTVVKKLYDGTHPRLILQIKTIFPECKTFRLMVQKGSRLIHIPKKFSKKIVRSFTQLADLVHSPLEADVECWFLIRNEGFAVFGIKAGKNEVTAFLPSHRGELRPKMAHILNLISEPKPVDRYLDPFSGYGALPWDRFHRFPYAHIYISDSDRPLVERLRKVIRGKNITVKHANALHLNYLEDQTVDKIVTDPPWGLYQMRGVNYEKFYHGMLLEMKRVVKEKGIIVILTARTQEFESALRSFTESFTLQKKYSTLVNGKKASVYKIDRKS